jgi:DNA-binding CsgD family transcriptional regulator
MRRLEGENAEGAADMDLRDRALGRRDFDACLSLFEDRLAYAPDTLGRLTAFWERLLGDDAMVTSVIERHDGPGRAHVLAFGASVFVTDAHMRQARRGYAPYLTARTIARELAGCSPILRPAAIRRANSREGLNLLLLHYGEAREGLSAEERISVRYKMRDCFIATHRGYQIQEILQEFWDELELPFILSGWGTLRADYRGYFRRAGLSRPPPERGPHLICISRAEAAANPGDMAAPLFVYQPPKLDFSPAEQALLGHALRGQTDSQLARSLGVALPTVKGRWRQIYARVAAVSPDLLPEPDVAAPGPARVKEKRRSLLDYLQRHPEELRPHQRRRGVG